MVGPIAGAALLLLVGVIAAVFVKRRKAQARRQAKAAQAQDQKVGSVCSCPLVVWCAALKPQFRR